MRVPDTNLVYFAYPKCGSTLVRKTLGLRENKEWNNFYNARNWEGCNVNYCHRKPALFKFEEGDIAFTLIRNPYERLVSAWSFLCKIQSILFRKTTFLEFMRRIDQAWTKDRSLRSLPMSWMYMPFEEYFKGVDDRIRVFKLDDLATLRDFLYEISRSRYDLPLDEVANASRHDHYTKVFNDETREIVERVYRHEISRFGFVFERKETGKLVEKLGEKLGELGEKSREKGEKGEKERRVFIEFKPREHQRLYIPRYPTPPMNPMQNSVKV